MQNGLNMQDSVLIYSMWGGYINPESKHANKNYLDFIAKFPVVEHLHTSGHASADCLAEVCNLVNPSAAIIPIHSEFSDDFKKLPIRDELKEKIVTASDMKFGIEIIIN
jgi:ribonuclease J